MKIRFFFFLLASGAVAFTGCQRINGKGAVETRHYDLSGFNEVELSNQGDIELVTDANSFVEVETNSNLFEALNLKVDGSVLKIDTKNGYSIGKYDKLTYYVHAPLIRKTDVSGSGNIKGGNGIAVTENFEANVSGSGNIEISGVVAQSVKANISGSGNITLNGDGTTTNAALKISGSGNINAFGLTSQITQATISGSGNIKTKTEQTLTVNISGSGDVYYKGTPSINMNGSGSGGLKDAN